MWECLHVMDEESWVEKHTDNIFHLHRRQCLRISAEKTLREKRAQKKTFSALWFPKQLLYRHQKGALNSHYSVSVHVSMSRGQRYNKNYRNNPDLSTSDKAKPLNKPQIQHQTTNSHRYSAPSRSMSRMGKTLAQGVSHFCTRMPKR